MKNQQKKSSIPIHIIDICVPWALLVLFFFFVLRFDFEPIAKFCIPALAVFFGFSSLLFNRARAYSSRGKSQIRTLYAAERALQATLYILIGMVIGAGMYALFAWFGFSLGQEVSKKHALLFLFLIPYFVIQKGFKLFMISLHIVSREYVRHVSTKELLRRIKDGK